MSVCTDGALDQRHQDQRVEAIAMPDAVTLTAILLYLSCRAAYASWKGE